MVMRRNPAFSKVQVETPILKVKTICKLTNSLSKSMSDVKKGNLIKTLAIIQIHISLQQVKAVLARS